VVRPMRVIGQPRVFAQVPPETATPSSQSATTSQAVTDPRFQSCSHANGVGGGNYVSAVTPSTTGVKTASQSEYRGLLLLVGPPLSPDRATDAFPSSRD
jgi:hypothetical protein